MSFFLGGSCRLRRKLHSAGRSSGCLIACANTRGAARCLSSFLLARRLSTRPSARITAGLYKIVRQMPEEEQAFDLKYLIKGEAEAYERNVLECQLSSNVRADSDYTMTKPRRSPGSHRR